MYREYIFFLSSFPTPPPGWVAKATLWRRTRMQRRWRWRRRAPKGPGTRGKSVIWPLLLGSSIKCVAKWVMGDSKFPTHVVSGNLSHCPIQRGLTLCRVRVFKIMEKVQLFRGAGFTASCFRLWTFSNFILKNFSRLFSGASSSQVWKNFCQSFISLEHRGNSEELIVKDLVSLLAFLPLQKSLHHLPETFPLSMSLQGEG